VPLKFELVADWDAGNLDVVEQTDPEGPLDEATALRIANEELAAVRRARSLGRLLAEQRDEVIAIAARRGASNVRVFGSVVRGEESETSDIDLLVDLQPGVTLVGLAGLCVELTDLLGVAVDVVPADMLKERIRAQVLAEATPL
jgi:hypothetical protein